MRNLKSIIYESASNGIITEYTKDKLIYIIEKEEDHRYHMAYKSLASEQTKKDLSKLPNKKYIKNPEKADMRYSAREKLIKNDLTVKLDSNTKGNDYTRKKPFDILNRGGIDDKGYDKFYNDIELKDKDIAIKALEYMKKHCNLKNEKEYKKYKIAFNIFCKRFHIEKDSSLWIKYNPGNEIEYEGKKYKLKDKITVGGFEDRGRINSSGDKKQVKRLIGKPEIKIQLPNGYKLYHKSDKINLRELKPTLRSTKFISAGPSGNAGQYHSTGRVYFTLSKDLNNLKSATGNSYGGHIYELVSPVNEIYFDSEHYKCFAGEDLKNLDYSKLENKPVFVKTNVPLKIKKIK